MHTKVSIPVQGSLSLQGDQLWLLVQVEGRGERSCQVSDNWEQTIDIFRNSSRDVDDSDSDDDPYDEI